MKQDRFLTGILVGIGLLVMVALAVFFTRKDSQTYVPDNTPEGVVHDYVVALLKKDYEKAYGYLADLENKPTQEQFHQSFLNHSVDPTNAGVEIGKAEIAGNSASVSLGLVYGQTDPFSNGYRNTDYAQLVQQKGAWKIKQMPNNFWAYDWYQPTPPPVK